MIRWEYMKAGDDDHIYDEEGNSRIITTKDYVFPYGKYQGVALADLDDVGYLMWAWTSNTKKKPVDWFFNKVVLMRLKELGK